MYSIEKSIKSNDTAIMKTQCRTSPAVTSKKQNLLNTYLTANTRLQVRSIYIGQYKKIEICSMKKMKEYFNFCS